MLERARQTVAFDVASAYFQSRSARAEIRVRAETLRAAEAIRRDVGTRRLGGTAERQTKFTEPEPAATSAGG